MLSVLSVVVRCHFNGGGPHSTPPHPTPHLVIPPHPKPLFSLRSTNQRLVDHSVGLVVGRVLWYAMPYLVRQARRNGYLVRRNGFFNLGEDSLMQYVEWLNSNPAGFKLNVPLARCFSGPLRDEGCRQRGGAKLNLFFLIQIRSRRSHCSRRSHRSRHSSPPFPPITSIRRHDFPPCPRPQRH